MTYYSLTPAYGRDYKSASEVKQAWLTGKDFEGDYQLGFQIVNLADIPKPCTVNLRYKQNRSVTQLAVATDATVQPETVTTPKATKATKATKAPSVATMQRWMNDGVAKATDGCRVEPDGHCEHGKPSWLIQLGVM